MIDSLKLPFYFEPERLQTELGLITPEEWVPHFNKPYYEGEWSGVALRSVGGQEGRLYPDPTAREQYADTSFMERCAYLREVIHTFECPLEAARLLKLAARSNIREHRDYQLGFDDGVVRIHIPIVTNTDVQFFLDDNLLQMLPGESWYLDLSLKHRVENHSDTDRIHLVIDCVVNDWVRALFPGPVPAPLSAPLSASLTSPSV